ncbi:MAG TPA: DNA alkylation repair protein, partial [Anaerolineae bacterium]
ELIKAEQRAQLEAVGIPIPALKAIGNEIAKMARKDVSGYVPLAQRLWDDYGREGRVVALLIFGAMELVEPERLVPLLKDLCKRCISWEDADRLAMDAVEPIVRKYPDKWLGEMGAWLNDENKWVRRASVTMIGRLPMKHPAYTRQCLEYTARLLFDNDTDVKRAVSFAIRMCAKTDPRLACAFLKKQVPAANPAAVWVLCDVIKSMDRKIVAEFSSLLPRYKKWSAAPDVSRTDQRSLESTIKVLQAS